MEYKKVTVVDENDVVLGYESYNDVISKGSIRRVSCVFMHDENGTHRMSTEEVDTLVTYSPEQCSPNFVEMWLQLRDTLVT